MRMMGVLFAILAVYFVWRFVVSGDALMLLTTNAAKSVTAQLLSVVPGKELVFEITNNGGERRITEASMPRSVASQLGIDPPTGFRAEELTLSESERDDAEMVEFVNQFNAKTTRWVGDFVLPAQSTMTFTVPVSTAALPLTGAIEFQYESDGVFGFGGSISFFRVDLDDRGER